VGNGNEAITLVEHPSHGPLARARRIIGMAWLFRNPLVAYRRRLFMKVGDDPASVTYKLRNGPIFMSMMGQAISGSSTRSGSTAVTSFAPNWFRKTDGPFSTSVAIKASTRQGY
jgi:hypothetical protein